MDDFALEKIRRFVDAYLGEFAGVPLEIVEVRLGATKADASCRPLIERQGWRYREIASAADENWPVIANASADVMVVRRSTDQIRRTWHAVRRIARALRPGGLACMVTAGSELGRSQNYLRVLLDDGIGEVAGGEELKLIEAFTEYRNGSSQDSFVVLQKYPGADSAAGPPFPDRSHREAGNSVYGDALAARPNDPRNVLKLSELITAGDRAVKALAGRTLEHAIALLGARQLSPADVSAAAHVFDRLGAAEQRMLTETLSSDGDRLGCIAMLADLAGQFRLAAACWEPVVAADPGDPTRLLAWALSLTGSGQMDSAARVFRRACELQLEQGIVNRTTVVQRLIRKLNAKSYLEIGIERGFNFFQIEAPSKFAVDPVFRIPGGARNTSDNKYFQVTSDVFFAAPPEALADDGLDIILIDGLHTREQALRDVENSLWLLNPGGVIVLHDCLPASEAQACATYAQAREMPEFTGAWTGDVFKAIVTLRATRPDLFVCVLDTDHGVGLVTDGKPESMLSLTPAEIDALQFADLRQRAEELLNLKPASWFDDWLNPPVRRKS